MPVELKYGAVRERHKAAERGHCDPARECGGDVASDCLLPNMSPTRSELISALITFWNKHPPYKQRLHQQETRERMSQYQYFLIEK